MRLLGCVVVLGYTGSWRTRPVRCGAERRPARLVPACEGADDRHGTAAAGARRSNIGRSGSGVRFRVGGSRRGRCAEDRADVGQTGLPVRAGEEAVVLDAVKAARQDMEEEAPDDLRGKRGREERTLSSSL